MCDGADEPQQFAARSFLPGYEAQNSSASREIEIASLAIVRKPVANAGSLRVEKGRGCCWRALHPFRVVCIPSTVYAAFRS